MEKLSFTRENLAIIKAGAAQFGESFFTDSNRKIGMMNN